MGFSLKDNVATPDGSLISTSHGSVGFALKLSGMALLWPNVAVSESGLGTFVIHAGHEVVL